MAQKNDPTPESVASAKDNEKLEHTRGGTTTRDDMLDAGVPMLAGDPSEPVGPEDAFGPGAKRGDYSGRIDAGPHLITEAIPDAEPGEAHTRLVDATARAADRGDEKGVKGGVGTA